jgi:hypothetical protein
MPDGMPLQPPRASVNAFRSAGIRLWSIVYLLRMGCGKVQIPASATTQLKRQVAPEQ